MLLMPDQYHTACLNYNTLQMPMNELIPARGLKPAVSRLWNIAESLPARRCGFSWRKGLRPQPCSTLPEPALVLFEFDQA